MRGEPERETKLVALGLQHLAQSWVATEENRDLGGKFSLRSAVFNIEQSKTSNHVDNSWNWLYCKGKTNRFCLRKFLPFQPFAPLSLQTPIKSIVKRGDIIVAVSNKDYSAAHPNLVPVGPACIRPRLESSDQVSTSLWKVWQTPPPIFNAAIFGKPPFCGGDPSPFEERPTSYQSSEVQMSHTCASRGTWLNVYCYQPWFWRFFCCLFFKSSVLFQILIINFAVVGDKRILICSFGFIAGLIKKI